MSTLNELTIAKALDGLKNKEFSASELTQACIDAMAQAKHLNAFITETPELALEQAKASDVRRAAGQAGALDGIPLAIKDLYCTEGVQTTAGSAILKGYTPTYESTVTQNLKDAGVVMLGKANTDEFAMGTTTETSHYGATINPWKAEGDDTDLIPGGSSGGSAAAVAARMALGATGTDTGGSIRQPAAMCGITGIKPTYGRCSRWGIVSYASSFDQAGPMAKTVEDCALLLNQMAGHDAKDSTSANIDVPDFTQGLNGDVKGMKIGIPKEYQVDNMPGGISKLWEQGAEWLKEQGAEIVDISLPTTEHALATYYILVPAEASSNLARYDGVRYGPRVEDENLNEMYAKTRSEGFGVEVKRRIMVGTYTLSAGYYDAYYRKAQRVRRLILEDFNNAFEKCDAILTPPTPSAAFPLGSHQDDPVTMYLNDIFTVPINLAGLPAMSVPATLNSKGLPLGLQIIGKQWDETGVLRVGQAIEKAANFTAQPQSINKKAA